jgi:hypothetical protein
MYNEGGTIGGGLAAGGALAATGLDTLAYAVAAIALTVGGLLLLRTHFVLHRREEAAKR